MREVEGRVVDVGGLIERCARAQLPGGDLQRLLCASLRLSGSGVRARLALPGVALQAVQAALVAAAREVGELDPGFSAPEDVELVARLLDGSCCRGPVQGCRRSKLRGVLPRGVSRGGEEEWGP